MKKFHKNSKFKKPGQKRYNPNQKGCCVTPYEGETPDHLIKRFKRLVEQAGIVKEVKRREHYITRSQKEREKIKKSIKRIKKKEREQNRDD